MDETSDKPTEPEEKLQEPTTAPAPEATPTTDEPNLPKPEDDEKLVDNAVSDIIKSESDAELSLEDSKATVVEHKTKWFKRKAVWIPAAVVVVLAIIFAVPTTRYGILGLFIKENYKTVVIDSQTSQPVSDAKVTLDGKTVLTNNQGDATIKAKVGNGTITITKTYYSTVTKTVLVPIKSRGFFQYKLQATGRQVPISLVNKISGAPVANAEVTAAGTSAKTNSSGKVTIVLPADQKTVSATITLAGYNTLRSTISVTTQSVSSNNFQIVPSGSIYYLSNASGTIDVLKANLDGSGVSTVLTGTGTEDPNNTTLLPSSDWSYLALVAQRSGSNPNLYIINTATDQLSQVDSSSSGYTLYGWTPSGYLIYLSNPLGVGPGTPGSQTLKSYNPATGKLTTLDESQAKTSSDGTTTANSYYENVQIMSNSTVLFVSDWQGDSSISGVADTVNSVQPNGGDKTALLTTNANTANSYVDGIQATPATEYFYSYVGFGSTPTYYEYSNGKVQQISGDATVAAQKVENGSTPYDYIQSPSNTKSLSASNINGHTAVSIADMDGNYPKEVALLDSTYSIHGWYTDNYIILSKNNNELDIMPATGLSGSQQPIKIADYFQ